MNIIKTAFYSLALSLSFLAPIAAKNAECIRIDVTNCSPEAIRRSPEEISYFLSQLAKAVSLKSATKPTVKYNYDSELTAGYSFAVVAEACIISGWLLNHNNSALFTILRLEETFDPHDIAKVIGKTFGGTVSVSRK